ncbi:MAG: hypothetical protein E7565_02795 [Ruminococcaceae bacterium]|nr:hypothetical protein [Oscillospiraceae bacterium]
MKKICAIFFIIIFSLLSGCAEKSEFSPPPYAIIEEPTEYTVRTADGYRDYNYKKNEKEIIYYGNKKTKVFHYSDCKYSMKINETSIIFDRNRDILVSKGYTPCGYCKP